MKAQYCWAHLIRDIRFLLKHPDKQTKAWAEQLLDRSRKMFSAWHRRDEMTDDGFHRSMVIQRDRFLEIVRKPPIRRKQAILRIVSNCGTCRWRQLRHVAGLFSFYVRFRVEPTNNHSEQQVRHCVIDRRITQGTRSESGQRYQERIWTAIATCASKVAVLRIPTRIDHRELTGQSAPSLLAD